MKFSVIIRGIHKLEKKNIIDINIFRYENNEKYPIYVSKKYFEEKHGDLLLIGEGEKNTMLLSMISIDSCMIILYIVKENTFGRYCLHGFITEEILKCQLKIALKLMVNKRLRRLRKVNMLNSKILKKNRHL